MVEIRLGGGTRIWTRIRALDGGGVCLYAKDLPGLLVQAADVPSALTAFARVAAELLAVYRASGRVPWESVAAEPGDFDGPQVVVDS